MTEHNELPWDEERIYYDDIEYVPIGEFRELERQLEIAEAQIDYYAEFLKAPGVEELFLKWANPSQADKGHLPPPF